MTHGAGEGWSGHLDLTPSPRLLEILGDIPYQTWQCLAELIDNAFDDFLADDQRDLSDPPAVHVTLPKPSTAEGDEIVCVADNGRGMTEQSLENALKAGYSQKSRYGSLGLFGMGFNIATARLGSVTEVRTTQTGDPFWLVAEIDFRRMQRERSFVIPLRREEKQDPSLHGTEVTVRKLRPDSRDRLRRTATATQIRERLGNVYSYMLRSRDGIPELPDPVLSGRGFALYVNGARVRPRLPCVWSPQREVDYRGRKIPAVIEINRQLKAAWACLRCGHWHQAAPERCVECDGDDLELRERRIVGWVGVQRYFDPTDFGIDVLRNGRKILVADKSLFDWEHPDTGEVWKEYPIELGSTTGGRLVGEVHLDHVPVVYQKNDFERGSLDWITAVHAIRGEGPLQPKKAGSVGFEENRSPLGLLFHGYRNIDPGTRYLIPGDGKRASHDNAREWAARFRSRQAEYLSDDKWYEQAVEHDRIKSGLSQPPPTPAGGSPGPNGGTGRGDGAAGQGTAGGGEDDLFSRTGLGDIFGPGGGQPVPPADPPPRAETEEERFERYRSVARLMHDLSGDVAIAQMGRRQVVAYDTIERLTDPSGLDTPCVSRSVRGNKIEVFVNSDHEVFRECGRDPRDYAIVQLSEQLRVEARVDYNISRVAAEVTTRLPDQRLTDATLRERVEGVLRRVREALAPITAQHAAALWACLSHADKTTAERAALADEPRLVWPELTTDGRFATYIGAGALAAIVRERPDLVLDGKVFTTTWATWSSDEAKDRQVARLARHLEALSEFMASADAKSRLDLAMVRLTLDMLDQETRWEEPT
jgi:Histidine kinase-, DNA gyrase B-, and HSP90-like ATPase